MEAQKVQRFIHQTITQSAIENGAREDDEFNLEVFQDRKRTIRLKRTKYKISTGNKFELDYATAKMQLPVFQMQKQEYELILIPYKDVGGFSEKSRYLLRSCGEAPFKLNGSFCFEALIERGDLVEIGFNRFAFLKPHSQLRLVNPTSPIEVEIIKSKLNVAIEGETGTGKSTLAKSVHEESGRMGAFVHLNLASFSPSLIESELFGHIKGAFTGAINDKKGALIEAHRGTLFLDEIDSLSWELQTKLLLFLDSQNVRAVGGSLNTQVDVRLIFASGTPLKKLVEQHKMRKDFYYRLTSGAVISLSSLRHSPQYVKSFCKEFESKHFISIKEDLVNFYFRCPWPGNFRQLQAHLNKKLVMSKGKKMLLDQSDYELLTEQNDSIDLFNEDFKTLDQVKRNYSLKVYLKCSKNLKKASQLLDISPNTLKAFVDHYEEIEESI